MITRSGGSAQAPTEDVAEWAEELLRGHCQFVGMERRRQRGAPCSCLHPRGVRGGIRREGSCWSRRKKGFCGAAAVPAVPAVLWLQQCPLRAVVTAGMTRGTRRALSMISLYQKKEQPDEQRCDGSADSRDAQ